MRKMTGKEGGLIFAMKVLKKVSLLHSEHLIYSNELHYKSVLFSLSRSTFQ